MQYTTKKQKSFLQNLSFIWIMLLSMGIVFAAVGIIMLLIPLSPESMNLNVNGVPQAATDRDVFIFRMVFLGVFGTIGLGEIIAGLIVAARSNARRKMAERLKSEGVRIVAEATSGETSSVRLNYRYMERLRCSYIGPGGKTYIFKSGYLRADPTPYLVDNKVTVYHDRDDISRYFVDIDGSVGLGSRVVEL